MLEKIYYLNCNGSVVTSVGKTEVEETYVEMCLCHSAAC